MDKSAQKVFDRADIVRDEVLVRYMSGNATLQKLLD
jgi:hypothetical protein